MENKHLPSRQTIAALVQSALDEDIGSGDISAQLIPETQQSVAQIITREAAVVCGIAWVEAVFQRLDPEVKITWEVADASVVKAGDTLCTLTGASRSLLTGERCALNFLQTLSGIATTTQRYVEKLIGTSTQLLDTRKTLPGLRAAQKYAVVCGGGMNHRMGLYDAYLIKENHVAACGSIQRAVEIARQQHPEKLIEVEVENQSELEEALRTQVQRILLDNFSLEEMRSAVILTNKKAQLEASGNITLDNIRSVAETGVDFISVGAITKNVQAIDLSMRFLSA